MSDRLGSTSAVRERPGKRRLLARQRRDSGRHPSETILGLAAQSFAGEEDLEISEWPDDGRGSQVSKCRSARRARCETVNTCEASAARRSRCATLHGRPSGALTPSVFAPHGGSQGRPPCSSSGSGAARTISNRDRELGGRGIIKRAGRCGRQARGSSRKTSRHWDMLAGRVRGLHGRVPVSSPSTALPGAASAISAVNANAVIDLVNAAPDRRLHAG
jgi:hypothetical protein